LLLTTIVIDNDFERYTENKMTDTSLTSEKQAVVDEQAERFIAIFSDLRKVLGAGFKHAHQQGFSTTQYMVLGLVERSREGGEPYTISTMAAKLGLDPATVVRTIDSLEKRGLVERQRDKQDRRQVFIHFTEAGHQRLIEAHQHFISRIRVVFQAMSAEGRASLLNGLNEFVQVGQNIAVEQERESEEQMTHP
jgi:DNA-binding MarR family transcriptional regulator